MYLDNKYTRWYNSIIHYRKKNIILIGEVHHIIPRCLGGSNSKENLVRLTEKEHLTCHHLLTKMVSDSKQKSSLYYAYNRMSHVSKDSKRNKLTAKQYEIARKLLKEAAKITNTGKVITEKTKKLMSISKKGNTYSIGRTPWNKDVPMTESAKNKSSKKLKGKEAWNKGIPASEVSNRKRKETWANKSKLICPVCEKAGVTLKFENNHFQNCKY